ncbi:MAG: ATP-binding protein [Anaerolineae bacterium]|nr:ATP-binding protein [Anaerolineae bacterium]
MESRFAELLTTAVRTVAAREHKSIACVQDELGYALNREGGSCIEYWRKGHIPADLTDLERLAHELIRREGLNRAECERLLKWGQHPRPETVLPPEPTSSRTPEAQAQPVPLQEFSAFVAGPPITAARQFFGRERALKRIFDLWRRLPMQHIAVIGPKRSGKTSLLHYVQAITRANPATLRPGQRHDWLPNPERYRWVFVDFQDVRMGNRERLLQHLITELELPMPTPCNLDTFMDTASQHLLAPSIILMDEIGAGLNAPELDEAFWWSLRSLVSHYTHGNLGFILAAHQSPAQLAEDCGKPSPFFNIFHTLKLDPLTETEARELINASPIPFAPGDVEWILEQSGCWPCLLQILCQTCLNALETGAPGNAWREEGLQDMAPFAYLLTP